MALARASRGARGRVFAVVALLATTLTFVIGTQPASAAPAIGGSVTGPASAPTGRTVTFTGTITNNGTDATDNFTSVDIENDGSTGLSLDPITDLGPLAFGASAPFTVTGTVTAAPGGTVQLHLTAEGVTASGPDPDVAIDSAVIPVTEAISGQVTGPTSAPTGRTLTFTGSITNHGTQSTDDFTSVDIENDGSTGLTLDPITDLGPLAFGQTAPFTVTATVTAPPGGTVQLRLRATGITAVGADPVDDTIDSAVIPATEAISGQVTGPASAPAGRTIVFSGTVTNLGASSADNFTAVTIVDDGSTGLTVAPIVPIGPLAFGQTAPFTATATVTAAPGGTVQLHLAATGVTLVGPDPVDDTIDSAVLPVTEAIVGTLTTAAPPSAPFGKNLTFEGTITNNGTHALDAFTTVVIADDGSTGLTITPVILGPVAAGQTAPFSVTAAVKGTPGSSAQLRLKATGITAVGADPVDDTIDSATFAVTEAVQLTVTAERKQPTDAAFQPCLIGSCTVSIHDRLRYTLTVTNVSDVTATDVKVTGAVPAGTTDVPTANPPATVTLAGGETRVFTREVTVDDNLVPEAVVAFTGSATYDAAAGLPPVVLNDRPAAGSPVTINATVVDPLMAITYALNDANGGDLVRGDVVGSTITLDNTGNTNATNTIVNVTLTNLQNPTDIRIGGVPAGTRVFNLSPTGFSIRLGALPPGPPGAGGTVAPADPLIVVSFGSTVVANPPGPSPSAVGTASVTFDGGGISPKTASDDMPILGQPVVSLEITPTPASSVPVPRGSQITYVVTASNAPLVAAALGVQVSFPIPAGTTFVSASASSGGPPATPAVGASSGTVTVTFPTVTAGDSETLTVTVQVAPGAAQVNTGTPPNDIVATASATYGPGTNPTAQAEPVGHELSVAELRLTSSMTDTNSAGDPPAERDLLAGDPTANTIVITNEGGSNATNTVLNVTLTNLEAPTNVRLNGVMLAPAQFSYNSTTKVLSVPVGTVAPGASQTVTFDAAVVANPTGPQPRFARTSSSVTFQNGGGSNSPQVAQIEIKNNPSLTLAIDATPSAPGPVPRDTNVTYEITATNAAGGGKATDVVVSFPIPVNTTFVSASAPGSSGTTSPAVGGTGTVTATFAKVNAGNGATLTVVVHVVPNPTKVPGDAPPNDPTPANDIVANASATYGPGSNPVANANPVAHEIRAADLTLAVDPPSSSIQKLQVKTVNVVIGNIGPDAATGTKTVIVDITAADVIVAPPNCTPVVPGVLTQLSCVVTSTIGVGVPVLIPIGVQRNTPGPVTVDASGLATTGPEIDENPGNNGTVTATVTFLQSESDVILVGAPDEVQLILGTPTQNVTFTVSAEDLNDPPNGADPAEGVDVTVDIPAQVRATAVNTSAGTCTALAAGSGNDFTCALGNIADGTSVTITVTVQGTTVLGSPGALVTATATSDNNEPAGPANKPNTDSVTVMVLKQPVDLTVNDGEVERLIQTDNPDDLSKPYDFTVRVTNNSPTYTAETYSLKVEVANPADNGKLEFTAPLGCSVLLNVVTCNGTNLAPLDHDDFVIRAEIVAAPPGPGPIAVRSTVTLTSTETQVETPADAVNNTDTWTLERNIPPAAAADVGPTVPAGATVVYDVLSNDSDRDVPNQTLTVSVPAPTTGVSVGADQKITIVTSAPGDVLVNYTISDAKGGSAVSTLKVRVVGPIATRVNGSFNAPPDPVPNSFGAPIPADLLDPARDTPIELLKDDLGKDADGNAFPATVAHAVTTATAPHVTGTVLAVPSAAGAGFVDYTPPPGYTSDAERTAPSPKDPDADKFSYTTAGRRTSDDRILFTVASSVEVEVTNQNPIGVDMLFDVTNLATQDVKPAADSIDGNRDATITVTNPDGSFTFDDEGTVEPLRKLIISCIGVLAPAHLDADGKPLPSVQPDDVCPNGTQGPEPVEGWQKAGGEALVLRPEGASGDVTAKLLPDGETVSLAADAAVVGEVDFHFVVTDVRGGAGFGKTTVKVPNTPPQVIEGVRTVLKNTPTIVVDTKLATSDNNQDVIIVSGTSTRTEHGTSAISDDKRVITYTPDRDYLGPDKLFYNVSDQRGGAAFAELQLNVIEQPSVLGEGLGAGTPAGGAGAGGPAGNLAATGGDPLPLTAAAGACMVLGLLFVQAGRRRQSRPLLDGARHLRQ